jgi:hypothetical protein
MAAVDQAQSGALKTAWTWLAGAAVTGLLVGVIAELLVGEASGGGVPGATSMAFDTALATVVASVMVLVVTFRSSARAVVVVLTTVLAVIALLIAWYAPMAMVLGATAFGLARAGDGRGAGGWVSRAGLAGAAIAALWLLVFIGIVAAELLRGS